MSDTIKSFAALCDTTAQLHHEAEETPLRSQHIMDRESLLVSSVRLIRSGDPTVQLSCPTGTLEEFEEEVHRVSEELRGKPRDAWQRFAESLLEGDLDALGCDFRAIQELYADHPA